MVKRVTQLTRAGLRREVESWPRERLCAFLLDRIERDPDLRRSVALAAEASRSAGAAVRRLRDAIDAALNVRFVERRTVGSFIGRLDALLWDVESLGGPAPRLALDAAWHFVEAVPRDFNAVHDEVELAYFCRELAEAVVKLAGKAGALPGELTPLLDAWLTDARGTCRFDDVPEVHAEARLSGPVREAVAAAAEERAASGSPEAAELRALARRLRRQRARRNGRSGA